MKKAVVVVVLVSLGNVFLPGRAEAKSKYEEKFLSQFHSDFGIELYKEKNMTRPSTNSAKFCF